MLFQSRQALLEVGDQVAGIFQAGMDAQHRPFCGIGLGRAPDMGRNDQAFKPAPGIADTEMLQPVDKPGDRLRWVPGLVQFESSNIAGAAPALRTSGRFICRSTRVLSLSTLSINRSVSQLIMHTMCKILADG